MNAPCTDHDVPTVIDRGKRRRFLVVAVRTAAIVVIGAPLGFLVFVGSLALAMRIVRGH